MTRTPRTPVHFPRMKVRGKRNRAKLAARHPMRYYFPHVLVGLDPATGATTFHAVAAGEERAIAVLVDSGPTRDGYGRIVSDGIVKPKPWRKRKRTRRAATPAPFRPLGGIMPGSLHWRDDDRPVPTRPRDSWSFSVLTTNATPDALDAVEATVFGLGRRAV